MKTWHLLGVLGGLLLAAVVVPSALAKPPPEPRLEGYWEAWLASAEHLMSDDERRVFAGLDDDLRRELFVRGFWQARLKEDGGEELLERWRRHFEEARTRFFDLSRPRAQAIFAAGSPARVFGYGGCGGPVRRIEVWEYNDFQGEVLLGRPGGFDLVFFEPSSRAPGTFRAWSPEDGAVLFLTNPQAAPDATAEDVIAAEIRRPCVPSTLGEMRAVKRALLGALDLGELRRRLAPPPPDPSWLDKLAAALDGEIGDGRPRLPAAPLEITFPGHLSFYTIVRGRVRIPLEALAQNADGLLFDHVAVVGDLYQDGRFAKAFEVVHYVAGTPPASSTVSLDFYRRLRPGVYRLRLRVEDGRGLALLREDRRLEVPWVDAEAAEPAGSRRGFRALLRPEAGVLTTFPSVRLLTSEDELMAGEVEVAAVTTGGPIGRVDFLLGGVLAGSAEGPPYTATFTLGESPEAQTLEAVAFDPGGREIARDRIELNVGAPRFVVRLVEPRSGVAPSRAKAEVRVPRSERLAEVELFLNDERFASFSGPPFVHPLPPLEASSDPHFVRAVARLESGEEAEDVVFVDPRAVEEVDVRLVELYTSVTDPRGRPVPGLGREAFRVFEDGEEQEVTRFDLVMNLPLHVTLLMDVSQSMRDRMAIATVSAQRFFEQVVTPKDEASLLVFNDDIRRVVPFTADVTRLRYGASGLRARGTTRLYDSAVYAVHYSAGRQGKKALIILSDGEDVDSDFTMKDVLEHTLRAGLAVYAIGLGLEHPETWADLERLALETGGRFFAIASASSLDSVYRQIEEDLRSQYLLVYRPPEGPRGRFRKVEIEVDAEGAKARTIHGYYP